MGETFRNLAIGALTICCAVIVALLALISMELSIAVFAVGALAYIITAEHKRRIGWEKAADFKIFSLTKKHDALEERVDSKVETPSSAASIHRVSVSKAAEAVYLNEKRKEAASNKAANMRKESVSFKSLIDAAPEQSNIKAKPEVKIISPITKAPAPANLPKEEITKWRAPITTVIEDADSLTDLVVEELMGHAVKNKRIDIFMQPTLRLPQRQRKFYELYSRVRAKSGVYIPAGRYLQLANENAQINDIDALLLSQCLDMAKATKDIADAPVFFMNITGDTLKNGQFMNKLLPFLAKNRDLAGQLVFEMRQAEFHALDFNALKIIGGLAKLGCAFSLDHVTTLNEDIADLQRFRVRYLKADAALFVNGAKNDRSYKEIMKAKRVLEGNGIGLIAEKIEDEATMRVLLDYDLHYGQGYLFGRPDLQGAYEPSLKHKRSA